MARQPKAGPGTKRFTATIEKAGVNPCVEVPERVLRAYEAHATAGRIRVEGSLRGFRFRATLMPVAGGGHRLYVNGGMRAATGVAVGDRVSFTVRPASQEVPPPRDVVAGLRRRKGAKRAFEALSPAHRRELLRYIDDARSPETRRQRILKTARHVLGEPDPPSSSAAASARSRRLWTCPDCGNSFVNPNQYHSCARHTLEEVLAGKPPEIQRLFERFRRMVEACGRVKLLAYRDRVGFMVRVRFAGATPKKRWLDVGFWLPRRLDHPRFRKVETIYPNAHVHSLRVTRPEELDGEVAGWIREAYAVGCQEHLRS